MQATMFLPLYIMQSSSTTSINSTQLSDSIAFYINLSLRHPHSHLSTIYQTNMTSSEQKTADPVDASPTKRKTRRTRGGGVRKAQSPKKRKNQTSRDKATCSHASNNPIPNNTPGSTCLDLDDAPLAADDWDPIEVIKNTFGEDCTYLDFPPEEENSPVEFPWSKEAAEMVADANFVYDVACEPYKHLYGF